MMCPGPWHDAVYYAFLKSRDMHAVAKRYGITTKQARGIVYWCGGHLTAAQIVALKINQI